MYDLQPHLRPSRNLISGQRERGQNQSLLGSNPTLLKNGFKLQLGPPGFVWNPLNSERVSILEESHFPEFSHLEGVPPAGTGSSSTVAGQQGGVRPGRAAVAGIALRHSKPYACLVCGAAPPPLVPSCSTAAAWTSARNPPFHTKPGSPLQFA